MHGITALLLAEYDEAAVLERIDDVISDYIDIDLVARDFNGDINACYAETGNREAENQVMQELLDPYKDNFDVEDLTLIMGELAEFWGISL